MKRATTVAALAVLAACGTDQPDAELTPAPTTTDATTTTVAPTTTTTVAGSFEVAADVLPEAEADVSDEDWWEAQPGFTGVWPNEAESYPVASDHGGYSDLSSTLAAIAACESGNDPTAVSPDGLYRGALQFDRETWRSVGGEGDPADASIEEQYHRGALLYEQRGGAPWPNCP